MAFDLTTELVVRKAISDKIATIPEAGSVNPSPLYLNDAAEFWATFDNSKDTKDEIETNLVAACWVYPLSFTDDLSSSSPDSPLVFVDFEIYLFRQYGLQREDETDTPDIFNASRLVQHDKFISAWLDIKAEFQGLRNIGLDPAIFAIGKTTSIVMTENIQNFTTCDFVPRIGGFLARMKETVQIKLLAC